MLKVVSKILTTVLLLTFFLNTNYVLMYYGVFKLNQTILAETVCEKKTEDCKGCCYLKKQIEQQSKDEQSTAELLKNKQKLSEFFVKYIPIQAPKNISANIFSETFFILSEGFIISPVKPPSAS